MRHRDVRRVRRRADHRDLAEEAAAASASAITNFVVLPMAFRSGTFFDISQAPDWLQAVSTVFPLRHMNHGMLDVLARGQGLGAVWVPCAILLGFTVVLTAVATRVFRWEDV